MTDMIVNVIGCLIVCVIAYIGMKRKPMWFENKVILTEKQFRRIKLENKHEDIVDLPEDCEAAQIVARRRVPRSTAAPGESGEKRPRAIGNKRGEERMKFIELTVHTTTEASEIIADIMWNYTNYGVTICDVNDIIALQKSKDTMYWDYMDDDLTAAQPKDVLVKCYIAEDIAEKTVGEIMRDVADAKEMSGGALPFGTLEDTKREVDGDDWIDVWKKHFRPIRLGRIVVVPEWIDYTPEADEKIVLLDSNMAFGTGEHETTSMCLELLQTYLRPGDTVVDVGCGSGILGIAAVKLGAKFGRH